MEHKILDSLKEELIIALAHGDDSLCISEAFKSKFWKLMELCTFSMLNGSEDFFAYFFIQMKRDINIALKVPCEAYITSSGFTMVVNPALFLEHSELEMQALIKHEIYHIISGHHLRARTLANKYSALAINLAMDITINEYIINLPSWMPKLVSVSKSYNVSLNENSTMEQYAEAIQKALDKLKKDKHGKDAALMYEESENFYKSYNIEEIHELWEKDEQIDSQSVKELTKQYALNASKGKLPKSIEEFLRDIKGKAELSWQDYLKRMLGTLPAGYKKTTTRKDRRQPDRLDLRGRLRQYTAELTVAIDISGSISDAELKQIMQEVLSIVKNYPHELSIMECDSEVRRVYKVKSIKNIRKKLNTRGATKFSPVFQYMKENNMRNHILIYFTDGLGEKELETIPVNRKTIWVLTGKEEALSLTKPYGLVKKLNNNLIEKPVFEYAPNAIKEYRMLEWSSF